MPERQPYDRLETESAKAYAAFVIYRDMGQGRSIETAWKQYSQSDRRVPGYIGQWATDYNWVARAAAWDDHIEAEARKRVERDAIKRKAEMLKRHADTGRFMQAKGIEYLKEHGVDKSSDALGAVKTGVTMERQAEGLPEYLMEIVNADDEELARQYHALLTQISGSGSGDEEAGADSPNAE